MLSLAVLTLVFINSLFTPSNDSKDQQASVAVVELDVNGMLKGDIRKVQWKGKEVNALRLENKKLFIYINAGDSGNCPLFKEANGLKDVCTGTRFDFSGKQKGNEEHGFKLIIPPNFYESGTVFIGRNEK